MNDVFPRVVAIVLLATFVTHSGAPATGPLRVGKEYLRYFADASGQAIYLSFGGDNSFKLLPT